MRLVRHLGAGARLERGAVATIGNFDGVHRGHQAMLARLHGLMGHGNGPVTVIGFEPHPREVLVPADAPKRITPFRDKVLALQQHGCQQFVCLSFGPALAALDAGTFIQRVLVERLGIRHLLIGDDFRFGAGRAGDYRLLEQAGRRHGFQVERMPRFDLDGERVSSTRVRAALEQGDLDQVERLLGRPYSLSGRVGNGDRIGRTLGFATANIRLRQPPALDGVLVADVRIDDEAVDRPAVVSIGTRPTVDGRRAVLEVHLLDWSGHLYGHHLSVCFHHWLRGQERYPSLEALTAQMERDRADARAWFARRERCGPARAGRRF